MSETIPLFLCGDVMTGRGIDQILPHPSDPHLYEQYVKDARRYVRLGEGVRLVVFGFGVPSSGIPYEWRASSQKPGLNLLPGLAQNATEEYASLIRKHTDPADMVLVSIHWGANWGYRIPISQRRFAHRLIDEAGVDLIHGHSSHHVKGIEVYRGKLIFYGCGDFINDYEGISGKEHFRGDLALMYFPQLDPQNGRLLGLEMVPLQRRNLQLRDAGDEDTRWLLEILNREGADLGTRFELSENRDLVWSHPG